MDKMMKITLNKLVRSEKGQALPIVLILLLIGGLIIGSLLGFMSTGVKAGVIHEQLMERLYAADAGVEDGLWRIKAPVDDRVPEYGDDPWVYTLESLNGDKVNEKQTTVEISYTWVLEGIESDTRGTLPHDEWAVTGRVSADGEYTITVNFVGGGAKKLERIGVWLPKGFGYVAGSSALYPDNITTDPPTNIENMRGGTIITWDWAPGKGPVFSVPPGETEIIETQTFNFTPDDILPIGDFAWVRFQSMDIFLSWDTEHEIYTITATATDSATNKETKIVAHTTWDTDAGDVGITTWEVDLQ